MVAIADPWWLVALKLGAVLFLVLLNGFFVAAEFAIVKVRMTQLVTADRRGDRRAKLAQHLHRHLDAYLSANQLGITLASLGLGWIGEPALATLIEPALVAAGVTSPTVIHTVAFALAFGTITFLHIVLGELAPKSLAIQRSQATTLWSARPLHLFYTVFKPAIWALNGTANAFLRFVGIRPATEAEMAHSPEELRLLLLGARGDTSLGRDLILNALDLRRRQVREIMVPRPRVVVLNATQSVEANLRVAWESGYTRFPLAERGDLDRLLGMVHLKDLLRLASVENATSADLLAAKRDLPLVPEGMPAEELLQRMLARRTHMAAVVDEYGGTVGLVTLEDILEELVGEIQDEFDEETMPVRRLAENEYLADGVAPLYQVSEALGVPLESQAVSTIGGYVVEKLGRIPAVGERVDLPEFSAIVRSADRKRVKGLLLMRRADAGGESGRRPE